MHVHAIYQIHIHICTLCAHTHTTLSLTYTLLSIHIRTILLKESDNCSQIVENCPMQRSAIILCVRKRVKIVHILVGQAFKKKKQKRDSEM